MTQDLEATLSELGPEYREVVSRLKAAAVVEPQGRSGVMAFPRRRRWRSAPAAALVAAAVLAVVAVAVHFLARPAAVGVPAACKMYTVAYAPTAEALATIVATQRSDGSWENDFITRQNAAALRGGSAEEQRIAYKRALRYLRSRGLQALSDEELRERSAYAARRLQG